MPRFLEEFNSNICWDLTHVILWRIPWQCFGKPTKHEGKLSPQLKTWKIVFNKNRHSWGTPWSYWFNGTCWHGDALTNIRSIVLGFRHTLWSISSNQHPKFYRVYWRHGPYMSELIYNNVQSHIQNVIQEKYQIFRLIGFICSTPATTPSSLHQLLNTCHLWRWRGRWRGIRILATEALLWLGAGGSAGARGDLLGIFPEDWDFSDVFSPPEPPEEDLGAVFALAFDLAEGRGTFAFATASSSSVALHAASTQWHSILLHIFKHEHS